MKEKLAGADVDSEKKVTLVSDAHLSDARFLFLIQANFRVTHILTRIMLTHMRVTFDSGAHHRESGN